jgi:hypothetical protein
MIFRKSTICPLLLCAGLVSAQETPIFQDGFEPREDSIIKPEDGATLDNDDDASHDAGYQVAVTFSTRDEATSWSLFAQECDSNHAICEEAELKANGAVVNPGGIEPVVLITINLGDFTTYHRILLETMEAIGNPQTTSNRITVNIVY